MSPQALERFRYRAAQRLTELPSGLKICLQVARAQRTRESGKPVVRGPKHRDDLFNAPDLRPQAR
ncbi:hypothetical protein THIOKS1860016 [Thiocapsa sp. KS1]|nr:hypothetical protein THIOKS1860016 [Thiocapsa sp. KS1]